MEIAFRDEGLWPRDQAEYVFLGRAVDIWGTRIFGSDWTGREKEREPMLPLPSFSESSTHQNRPARREAHLILSSDPAYIACPFVPAAYQTPPFSFQLMPKGMDYDFSESAWQRAKMIREEQLEKAAPEWKRLGKVRHELLEAFVMGGVRTGTRERFGATITPLPPEVWSVVNASSVFGRFQIDPDAPTTIASAGTAFRWIFVSRQDLASFVRGDALPLPALDSGSEAPSSLQRSSPPAPPILWATEASVREAFESHVAGWPLDRTHPSEEDDNAILEILLGKRIRRPVLRRVRREIAPSWIARGRPTGAKSAKI